MAKIPRIVHFVFGLKEQKHPFHLLHYLAIESCRQILRPDQIVLYYHHLPFGVFWDMIRPQIKLVSVEPVEAVRNTQYDEQRVPEHYRYAHHADFIRLDALIAHGGIYADIDTLFLRPIPDELYQQSFVIGREQDAQDELTGELKPSLCNALMMAEPDAAFARVWRERMADSLNGTWSNHSCFLAQQLADEFPETVHIEPVESFMGIPLTPAGLSTFLEGGELDLSRGYSVHLWQHVWWEAGRQDFSQCHAGQLTLKHMREGESLFCRLARPFLPEIEPLRLDGLPV